MLQIKRADWVTCKGSTRWVGVVKRVARDGSWADVNWHTHTKRMGTQYLTVQTTIPFIDGWTVTDVDRAQELGHEVSTGNATARCRMCGGDYPANDLIDASDGSGEHVCKGCMGEMCPFCPLMGIEIGMWQSIGNDFFGEPATIGGIPSCDACALVIDTPEYVAEMVAKVKELGLQ